MVTSQEIIERSFYMALMENTLRLGLTVDPNLYEKTKESMALYQQAVEEVKKNKSKFIQIFGVGNSQSKGMKESFPRIVVESEGFAPGGIGLNRFHREKQGNKGYVVSETPFEAIDQYINVRLVSKNSEDQRLLNLIMNSSIPQRGYLKPYIYERAPFDGNIFVIASNFYDNSNDERGIIEKVYTWEIQDTLLQPPVEVGSETPINEINIGIFNKDTEQPLKDNIHIP